MTYRLDDGEPTRDGLRRSAREELDDAIHDLQDRFRDDPVESVHDARKSVKKLRSLLRIARGSMRAAERRSENAALREAARQLSSARDADVMIVALDKLTFHHPGKLPRISIEAMQARLERQRDVARLELMASGAPTLVAQDLKAIRQRVADWHLERGGWNALGPGLRRAYREGRRAFERATKRPTAENLHEWRKRCKDLWYHLRLLEAIAPPMLGAQMQEAHELSDLLGDEHDLAVLRDAVQGQHTVDMTALLAAIERRRAELQLQARHIGRRLYAESPTAFTDRLHAYWKVWREQAEAATTRERAEKVKSVPASEQANGAAAAIDGDVARAAPGP